MSGSSSSSAGAAPDAEGDQHPVLRRWAAGDGPRALRAAIVLLAVEGLTNADIARRLGVSRQTVTTWRQRYAAEGVDGLMDRARAGRPTQVDEGEIVVGVLTSAPEQRTSRLLARKLGCSHTVVAETRRRWNLTGSQLAVPRIPVSPAIETSDLWPVGLHLDAECTLLVLAGRPASPIPPSRGAVVDGYALAEVSAAMADAVAAATDARVSTPGAAQNTDGAPVFLQALRRTHPKSELHAVVLRARPALLPAGDIRSSDAWPGDVRQGEARSGNVRPGDVRSGDAWPGGARPGDVQSGDIRPGDVRSDDVQPGDAWPGDVQSGGVQPGGAWPSGVQPGDAWPGGVLPGDVLPSGVRPGDVQSGDVRPGDAWSGDVLPGDVRPSDAQSGDIRPGDVQPGDAWSSGVRPGDLRSGGARPSGAWSGGARPGGVWPGDARPSLVLEACARLDIAVHQPPGRISEVSFVRAVLALDAARHPESSTRVLLDLAAALARYAAGPARTRVRWIREPLPALPTSTAWPASLAASSAASASSPPIPLAVLGTGAPVPTAASSSAPSSAAPSSAATASGAAASAAMSSAATASAAATAQGGTTAPPPPSAGSPGSGSGANQIDLGSFNECVVIETVRLAGQITRGELAERTRLTGQSVSRITRSLIQRGLLVEERRRHSAVGKPSSPVRLRDGAAHALGIHIDPNVLTAVLVDLSGRIVARRAEPITSDPRPGAVVTQIAGLGEAVLEQAGHGRWESGFLGIGVATPGPVDTVSGTVLDAPLMSVLRDVPLRTLLERRFACPIVIEKDCSAAAVGERWIGRGSRACDFVYLYLGTGVGTGLFLNGDLYRGLTANAGEFGQLCAVTLGRFDASGRPEQLLECNPGSYHAADRTPRQPAAGARNQNQKRMTVLQAAKAIGKGVLSVIDLLDVGLVVIGGPFFTEEVAELYLTEIEHAANAYPTARRLRRVRVERSVNSSEAVAVGAASTIFHATFTPRLRRTP